MAKIDWLIASKQRAIELGYEPIEAPEAFGGEVFIKSKRPLNTPYEFIL